MNMLTLDKIGRVILIFGLILLLVYSFAGLETGQIISAMLLVVGVFFTKPKNMSTLVVKYFNNLYTFLTIIECLMFGLLFYTSVLFLKGLINVQWGQVYYFSPDVTPKLLAGSYGFPHFGLLVAFCFVLTLIMILLVDGATLRSWPQSKN
jgi:hypothetical protein